MNLYLAGKISERDWRHDVVEDLGKHIQKWTAGTWWPVIDEVIFGKHGYTGPYYRKVEKNASEELGMKPHRLCIEAVNKSDMVFAWIDDPTCYATLFELGHAHGRGIYTCVAYPKNFDKSEFWFTTCCATDIITANSPITALQAAVLRYPAKQQTLSPPELPTPHKVTVKDLSWDNPKR